MNNPFLPTFDQLPSQLPIFPLTGAVLMPGVQLPLNIFEPRYLNLVQTALAGDHLLGMVQPMRASEQTEETPPIHRVGCAGRITSYSETNDGRLLIVLTGLCRFEILLELEGEQGFRRIAPDWSRFASDYDEVSDDIADRDQFIGSLRSFCDQYRVEIPWDDLNQMPDSDMVNLLCTHLPLPSEDKQALIETIDLPERANLMRGLMEMSALGKMTGTTTEHRH